MRISTKFSVAVHALILIAIETTPCTSAWIAGSVNTNPVVIRRIVGHLQKAGIIKGSQGKSGYELQVLPKDLSLLTIYKAIAVTESDQLFEIHKGPNLNCAVGASIQMLLESILDSAQEAMEAVLAAVTLDSLINRMP